MRDSIKPFNSAMSADQKKIYRINKITRANKKYKMKSYWLFE